MDNVPIAIQAATDALADVATTQGWVFAGDTALHAHQMLVRDHRSILQLQAPADRYDPQAAAWPLGRRFNTTPATTGLDGACWITVGCGAGNVAVHLVASPAPAADPGWASTSVIRKLYGSDRPVRVVGVHSTAFLTLRRWLDSKHQLTATIDGLALVDRMGDHATLMLYADGLFPDVDNRVTDRLTTWSATADTHLLAHVTADTLRRLNKVAARLESAVRTKAKNR